MTSMTNDEIAEGMERVLRHIAGAQSADGTRLDDDTWCWVQAQMDFDYEQSFLVEVRGDKPPSDYLGVCWGYDSEGKWFREAQWWLTEVPAQVNIYDAMRWWVSWTEVTREGKHRA